MLMHAPQGVQGTSACVSPDAFLLQQHYNDVQRPGPVSRGSLISRLAQLLLIACCSLLSSYHLSTETFNMCPTLRISFPCTQALANPCRNVRRPALSTAGHWHRRQNRGSERSRSTPCNAKKKQQRHSMQAVLEVPQTTCPCGSAASFKVLQL
jgi:hypothetical protein